MSITPNVLATRYATKEMVAIFDPINKIINERKFWITILKLQQKAGLPITSMKKPGTKDILSDKKRSGDFMNFVFAKKMGDSSGEKFKAQILGIENGIYTVKFEDGTIEQLSESYLSIYFDCNCVSTSDSLAYTEASLAIRCGLVSGLSQV